MKLIKKTLNATDSSSYADLASVKLIGATATLFSFSGLDGAPGVGYYALRGTFEDIVS